jgi:hypothetical protein
MSLPDVLIPTVWHVAPNRAGQDEEVVQPSVMAPVTVPGRVVLDQRDPCLPNRGLVYVTLTAKTGAVQVLPVIFQVAIAKESAGMDCGTETGVNA